MVGNLGINGQNLCFYFLERNFELLYRYLDTLITSNKLAVAQLVERWTVVANLKSIGRWFDSGLRDILFSCLDRTFYLRDRRSIVMSSCTTTATS